MATTITGTYRDNDHGPLPGWWEANLSHRLSDLAGAEIYPAGRISSGQLSRANGSPSLATEVPSTDDENIVQRGWHVEVRISFFDDLSDEIYLLNQLPGGAVVDLSAYVPAEIDGGLASGIIIEGPPGADGAPGRDGVDGADGLDGAPGRGIASITNEDSDGVAVIAYSDGETSELPLPRGKDGGPGTPGHSVTVTNTEEVTEGVRVSFSDGTVVIVPRGPAGVDGTDGQDGLNDLTPNIGENGNWWIGNADTGVAAAGQDGVDGQDGEPGPPGQFEGVAVTDVFPISGLHPGELLLGVDFSDGNSKTLLTYLTGRLPQVIDVSGQASAEPPHLTSFVRLTAVDPQGLMPAGETMILSLSGLEVSAEVKAGPGGYFTYAEFGIVEGFGQISIISGPNDIIAYLNYP
ncbi:hypothetical protein [Corynebacterium sp. A21]|uniref:hypothetical protein n=1 Tax=Corynebacterium sp. A21 TaxID=3457318 RepID=UPI003FD02562